MRISFMYLAATGFSILAAVFLLRKPEKAPDEQLSPILKKVDTKSRERTSMVPETDSSFPATPGTATAYTDDLAAESSTGGSPIVSRASDERAVNPMSSPGKNRLTHAPATGGNGAPNAQSSENVEPSDDVSNIPPFPNNSPLPAVRLADDVPLPAVILAIHTEQNDPENKRPQPVKNAMKVIVDTFYQDLAKAAAQGEQKSIDPDGTHVIGKGPPIDNARTRANDVYRALFGDAAYNQMTMNAVLDAQLPVAVEE